MRSTFTTFDRELRRPHVRTFGGRSFSHFYRNDVALSDWDQAIKYESIMAGTSIPSSNIRKRTGPVDPDDVRRFLSNHGYYRTAINYLDIANDLENFNKWKDTLIVILGIPLFLMIEAGMLHLFLRKPGDRFRYAFNMGIYLQGFWFPISAFSVSIGNRYFSTTNDINSALYGYFLITTGLASLASIVWLYKLLYGRGGFASSLPLLLPL